MVYRVRLTRKPTRFLRSAAQVEIILKQYEFEFEHRLMRIISRRTLRDFYLQDAARYNDARAALEAWYHEVKKASWQSPSDIKAQYRSASILKGGRVVFNIAGNKYRLVVKINYPRQIVYIRFVGTHQQYDQINAEEV